MWCPKEDDSDGWTNILSDDQVVFEEFYSGTAGELATEIAEKRTSNVDRYVSHPIVRITFMRFKDNNYNQFLGIYTLDIEKSIKNNSLVWERVTDRCVLKNLHLLILLLQQYK